MFFLSLFLIYFCERFYVFWLHFPDLRYLSSRANNVSIAELAGNNSPQGTDRAALSNYLSLSVSAETTHVSRAYIWYAEKEERRGEGARYRYIYVPADAYIMYSVPLAALCITRPRFPPPLIPPLLAPCIILPTPALNSSLLSFASCLLFFMFFMFMRKTLPSSARCALRHISFYVFRWEQEHGGVQQGKKGSQPVGSCASRVLGGIALFAFWLHPPSPWRCLHSGLCF